MAETELNDLMSDKEINEAIQILNKKNITD